jgi:hypothetical protein
MVKGMPVRLQRSFYNSVYSTWTMNFGPRTHTVMHRDSSNAAGVPCAITAMGNFDPDYGGHLVIHELKLIIRFPPGATIILPSASFTHGNIPIRPGETRTSFTQYVPGGLLRYADWGFKKWSEMDDDEKDKVRAGDHKRFMENIQRFSKADELGADIIHNEP